MSGLNPKICRWGNSHGVRLPKALLDLVGLKENDTVSLSIEGETVIIKKTSDRPYLSLQERFAGYTGDYEPSESEDI